MPLPMVHLAIAQKMKTILPKHYNRGEIYLGSIAPDAIHIREGFVREYKYITHLKYGHDGDVIKRLLEKNNGLMDSFHLGYLMHVFTDMLWLEEVFRPFLASLPEGSSDRERNRIYYGEMRQLDHELYAQSPWCNAVFASMKSAKIPQEFSLLSAHEMKKWRDQTILCLQREKTKEKKPLSCFSQKMISDFIDKAIADIQSKLPIL